MQKPVVKCLLCSVLSVIFITGFCVSANASSIPIYAYDETELIYNGGSSFSLNCPIYDPTYLCNWITTYVAANSPSGFYTAGHPNQSSFPSTGNLTSGNYTAIYLRFGLAGFSDYSNSLYNLTSGNLPVGTVVRFDFAIRYYFNGAEYDLPQVRHYNGVNTTSWIYPDGYSSNQVFTSQEIFYFTYDFTITSLNSYLGSEFYVSTHTPSGGRVVCDNVNIQFTFPIEDASYCLENGIITRDQFNVIQNTLYPGSAVIPYLQGSTNDYPSVAPDTLPPEVESYDSLFVPSDIDDSEIQSYLDRLDIGSWFRDFWNKMNSINIYLILIVIVLVLIFIRTLFMNFSNFIPK